ncbi:MAG TPA: 30S ribosomal protein S2 [Acidimicrobiales bacterium]|jgi:small subunit ribosomal protein S2
MEGEAVAVVTTRQLLEAGMHFGHQTRRWNPKMRRFILGERNGIYIIDLNKTLAGLEEAYGFVRDLVAKGGIVLFVGTKKQTQGPIATYARACGMPFVNERWLGGMLTNFSTISSRTGKLREYEAMERAGDFEAMPKKEALKHRRELEKLRRNLGGIRDLDRLPDTVFVIDTKKEHIAVTEANKLGMPIVAVVDTNCDPDVITYVIPGNDDAIRSGALMCRVLAEAVVEGRWVAENQRKVAPPAPPAATAGRGVRRPGAGTTGTLEVPADAGPQAEDATAPGATPSPAAPAPAPAAAAATPPAPGPADAPVATAAPVPAPEVSPPAAATAEAPAPAPTAPVAAASAGEPESTPPSTSAASPADGAAAPAEGE